MWPPKQEEQKCKIQVFWISRNKGLLLEKVLTYFGFNLKFDTVGLFIDPKHGSLVVRSYIL